MKKYYNSLGAALQDMQAAGVTPVLRPGQKNQPSVPANATDVVYDDSSGDIIGYIAAGAKDITYLVNSALSTVASIANDAASSSSVAAAVAPTAAAAAEAVAEGTQDAAKFAAASTPAASSIIQKFNALSPKGKIIVGVVGYLGLKRFL